MILELQNQSLLAEDSRVWAVSSDLTRPFVLTYGTIQKMP